MKICILAAGKGSRMGTYSEVIHKALLPLGNRAIISHIIEKFGVDQDYVIAVGFGADQIKDFIKIAHPDLKVEFVEVLNYAGKGSGPGLSLYTCRQKLQEPFYFTACDTIIGSDLPNEYNINWVGVNKVNNISDWCSVDVDEAGSVYEIHYKENVKTNYAFVGVAFIKDYSNFWSGFESNFNLYGGELQVNNGLEAIISKNLKAISIDWQDAGNIENYERLLDLFEKNYTFKGKITDITYRYGNRIIKYFSQTNISHLRYQRALNYSGIFANVIDLNGGFYSYSYKEGQLLSSTINYKKCTHFLEWAQQNLWKDIDINPNDFNSAVYEFYYQKTIQRLKNYCSKFSATIEDQAVFINDYYCEPVKDLLQAVFDKDCLQGIPSTYHGDLHSDNIIVIPEGYTLIDWRHAFGSLVECGDRYYDLAKFLHTLELSVETMDTKKYTLTNKADYYYINHECSFVLNDARQAFKDFVTKFGYSELIIEIINSIIFINMAPLYAKDMADYLYFIGRYSLQKAVAKVK
jgi:dTDP-glucose pyrophosphorylase